MKKLDSNDWAALVTAFCIFGVIGLIVLENFEITDVFIDVPRIEQPACVGDQIIVGRDE